MPEKNTGFIQALHLFKQLLLQGIQSSTVVSAVIAVTYQTTFFFGYRVLYQQHRFNVIEYLQYIVIFFQLYLPAGPKVPNGKV